MKFELGIHYSDLERVIDQVAGLVKQKMTPGGWPQKQEFKLMPGIDFKLASSHFFPDLWRYQPAMKDWMCIREIWDTELGGCVLRIANMNRLDGDK